ncbi:E3 ubiquitin/ISG15 ligase TRIM25-like isoform X1 [Aix galericulata]|nr:E3 ubiquitin/ISG15 ligase TRIM25-like isoform X1 [Aix galericulata]
MAVQRLQWKDSTRGEEEKHKVQCEEMGENSGHQNEKVMCDFCLEKPLPMVKSHLSCETSLCQAHLDKHSTKASLKDHILVEPCDVDVFAERRCPQHGKLLECYHVTDSVCICVLCCVTSSPQIHKIVSVEEAFGQAQNDFPKTLQSVKKYEAAVNRSLENLLKLKKENFSPSCPLAVSPLLRPSGHPTRRLRTTQLHSVAPESHADNTQACSDLLAASLALVVSKSKTSAFPHALCM